MKVKERYYKMTEQCLKNYYLLETHMQALKEELKEIALEGGIKVVDYAVMKTAPTYKINRAAEDTAMYNIDRENLITKQIELYESKINRIQKTIYALDTVEWKIIISKYLQNKQWYVIAMIFDLYKESVLQKILPCWTYPCRKGWSMLSKS
ncbi:hypothetical protein AN619_30170 [Thermotalea metallivorans]|uniref:Uncharacterized protein n=1 Tax=Thermotalea metallivorans TaxID=520762 RepID=A0A140KZC4_9FIRM|nr:hypothetical protein [Thermotalea metallivorans]KXG73649.1 hypothetical protein AN619_30170 [Thermotalea metallivorans]